jgi:hypothetical protein
VFTYAVKEVYAEMLKLFTHVPQFSPQSACQTYVDIFCLSDTFKTYSSEESKETLQKILKLIPNASIEKNKKLMNRMIADFQRSMQPYISVMQQQPPPTSVTIAFATAQQTTSTPSSGNSNTNSAASSTTNLTAIATATPQQSRPTTNSVTNFGTNSPGQQSKGGEKTFL